MPRLTYSVVGSCFSPCGRFVLSGSSNGSIHVWDTFRDCANPSRMDGHAGEINGVAWDPVNVNRVVSCSDDGTLRVWTRLTPRQLRLQEPQVLLPQTRPQLQHKRNKRKLRNRTLMEMWQHQKSSKHSSQQQQQQQCRSNQ